MTQGKGTRGKSPAHETAGQEIQRRRVERFTYPKNIQEATKDIPGYHQEDFSITSHPIKKG